MALQVQNTGIPITHSNFPYAVGSALPRILAEDPGLGRPNQRCSFRVVLLPATAACVAASLGAIGSSPVLRRAPAVTARRRRMRRTIQARTCAGYAPAGTSTVVRPKLCESLRKMGRGHAGTRYLWEWQTQHFVHFELSGAGDLDDLSGEGEFADAEQAAVVMVHGFGANSGYFSEQLDAVASIGAVGYAVDLVGQGRSWPEFDPTAPSTSSAADVRSREVDEVESTARARGEKWGWGEAFGGPLEGSSDSLGYGEPFWLKQLADFVRIVVREKRVYIMGNSVGGYLAAKLAAREAGLADRIKGVVLVNATPFWGWFNESLLPWDGRFPMPAWVRNYMKPLVTTWFGALEMNIGSMLGLVYGAPEDHTVAKRLDTLSGSIAEAASHPMAPAAFASILFSPVQSPSFGDALEILSARENVSVLLLCGEDDPWVVPFWVQRAASRFHNNARGEYYALSPAGHCPHHEAPDAFNRVFVNWLARMEEGRTGGFTLTADEIVPLLSVGDSETCSTEGCDVVIDRRL